MSTVIDIVAKYDLSPHPEGGYYREVYRSAQTVTSLFLNQKRSAVTHIYFLLASGQISRFHRVVHDEIWNFYRGDALKVITWDGQLANEIVIGGDSEHRVAVVQGGLYQAAQPLGEYSLVGCTVAPGFEFADFSFLGDNQQQQIAAAFPEYKKYI